MVWNNKGACIFLCRMFFVGHQRVSAHCSHLETQTERSATILKSPSWSAITGCCSRRVKRRVLKWNEHMLLTYKWAKRCNIMCLEGKRLEIFGISTNDIHTYILSHFRGSNSLFVVSCGSLMVNDFLMWSMPFSNCAPICIGSDCGRVPADWLCIGFCWRN